MLSPTPAGCEAEFKVEGRIGEIVVPADADPVRTDNLWKTTCFEIFWQPAEGSAYREFNLSPSGRWAAYDFDGFREGMRDAPVDAIALSCSHDDDMLTVKAEIAADLPVPAEVALNAIIKTSGGDMQFWALAFAPGKPEFHSEECRQWSVEARA